MWVWPQATVGAVTSASTSAQRSGGLSTSTISSSRRGEAWQNSTGPRPSTSRVTVSGRPSSRSRWAGPTRAALAAAAAPKGPGTTPPS